MIINEEYVYDDWPDSYFESEFFEKEMVDFTCMEINPVELDDIVSELIGQSWNWGWIAYLNSYNHLWEILTCEEDN
jgi:hypothetical protein